jgi:hypothetical protein
MKIHFTHVGVMHLKHIPISELLDWTKTFQSYMLKPNKYVTISYGITGILLINSVLAGFDDRLWSLTMATEYAKESSMQIVASLEYHVY